VSMYIVLGFSPFPADNTIVAMVAMGIPSSAFVRYQATACSIFIPIRPSWPRGMRFPPLFSSFSASFPILTSLLGLWRDAETLFIRQGDRFSSNVEENVVIAYPRALSLWINRNFPGTRIARNFSQPVVIVTCRLRRVRRLLILSFFAGQRRNGSRFGIKRYRDERVIVIGREKSLEKF